MRFITPLFPCPAEEKFDIPAINTIDKFPAAIYTLHRKLFFRFP